MRQEIMILLGDALGDSGLKEVKLYGEATERE